MSLSIQRISKKDLTKSQRTLLKETLNDIRNKRRNRFMSLKDLEKNMKR